jgi:hypothetical protein
VARALELLRVDVAATVQTEMPESMSAFYRKWGFVEVGAQVFRLGRDVQNDVVMQRSVNDGT